MAAVISLSVIATPLLATGSVSAASPFLTPVPVSLTSLPTAQIDGIVWAQVTVGNIVYATGKFTTARPAGSAPNTNLVTRNNAIAYNITTGIMTSFNPSLNAQGRAIAASPDGTRVYIGGDFTTVNGQTHNRIAAFNTSTGALVTSFTGGVNGNVKSLAATNSAVYVGGSFTSSGGNARVRLAAFNTAGSLTGWAPTANSTVSAMVMSADKTKVIVGGNFSTLNGSAYHSLGALHATTGAALPWDSQRADFPIRNEGSNTSITGLSANAKYVFVTGFNFGDIARPGGFEGRAAISQVDGKIVWLNDCHGDSYSSYPIGNVLYSVGHAHDCEPAGYFTQSVNPRRALAEGVEPNGAVNGAPTNGYTSFQGLPTSGQYNWYPFLKAANVSGSSQAAWSVTGNSQYISLGGEFTAVGTNVNGSGAKGQQGLVRYKIN